MARIQEEQVAKLQYELRETQRELNELKVNSTVTKTKEEGERGAYQNLLSDFTRLRDERTRLSQYLTQLEVQFVHKKIELIEAVNLCNTYEQRLLQTERVLKEAGLSLRNSSDVHT